MQLERQKLWINICFNFSLIVFQCSFEKQMNVIRGENQAAYQWLAKKNLRNWTRAYMKEFPKCNMLCNNMCEAFNSTILQAREKPVITLMEMVRNYLMGRMARKREEIKKWNHSIGPKVLRYLEKVKLASSCCNPKFCREKSYQVRCFDSEQYVVDLKTHTCACRKWQLVEIPCMHAFSCINLMNLDVYDFIHPFYNKEAYLTAYSSIIHEINGPNMWAKINDRPDHTKQRTRRNYSFPTRKNPKIGEIKKPNKR
ncbi:hypothetical protein UlMin_039489 [Ulmus minor]